MIPHHARTYPVQVASGHYTHTDYLSPARWSTYARVIAEVLHLRPASILEIGPGPGVVSEALKKMGFPVKTLDFDPAVQPDYLLSVTDPKLAQIIEPVDLVIASEIFEHISYNDFRYALKGLSAASNRLLLTLPDTNERALVVGFRIRLPLLNSLSGVLKIRAYRPAHQFQGQHYWEIGKRGYPLSRVRQDLALAGWDNTCDFLNIDNPYHRFFIAKKRV